MFTLRLLLLGVNFIVGARTVRQCAEDNLTFELVTGYVYSAPGDLMDTIPSTLLLERCIEYCRFNTSCRSINFETGLCVMFSSSSEDFPGALTKSQFPVFTLYAQKTCLRMPTHCGRSWSFEIVQGHELITEIKRHHRVVSRQECMELCFQEREFSCRSANYNQETGECAMSDMDRFTVAGIENFVTNEMVDYIESNCVSDPIKMCDFQEIPGRILKTVDSVRQDVKSLEECKSLCLSANFRCHTFDYEVTGYEVCRFSHHSTNTLQHIEEPYLDIDNSFTYQLMSCYNVTIDCRSSDMVARIETNKIFNGKVYSKNRPNSCMVDVLNKLQFELHLRYNDLNCDVKQDKMGKFSTDIIIQHHDQIVTSQDIGLSVRCSYDLHNRSVSNQMDLGISDDLLAATNEESVAISPTVTMSITSRSGEDIFTAQVGDPLSLRFEILDRNSPYEIFVRELVALDGVDSSEVLLVDSLGCPTDPTIMGPISKVSGSRGKVLQAPFDAFKFPTSDIVQFKALVTPCLPVCKPVACNLEDYNGVMRRTDSYGRRRRRDTKQIDEMLLTQTIRIADSFNFKDPKPEREADSNKTTNHVEDDSSCVNIVTIVVVISVFLVIQFLLIIAWTILWQWKRRSGLPNVIAGLQRCQLLHGLSH